MCAQQGSGANKRGGEGRRCNQVDSHQVAYLALLSAGGLALFVFENLIPYPFPWMRLGLGNIATLLALLFFTPKEALWVTLIRVVVGSLVVGKLLSPSFLLSLCGGLASLGMMAFVVRFFYPQFGPAGISIFGALAHNLVQLAVVYLLLVKEAHILFLLPMLLFSSVVTGLITGILATLISHRLYAFGFPSLSTPQKTQDGKWA